MKLTGEQFSRASLAAQTSARCGGVLPESRGYNLPPLLTGLDILQMGQEAFQEYLDAADWVESINLDMLINLHHPDVRAVL